MSETTTWGDDAAEAPKKKSIPTWLWFCGSGCLLAMLLVVSLVVFVGPKLLDKVKDLGKAEKQLPVLAQALPFDDLPSELEFQFRVPVPMDFYVFGDSRGWAAVFYVASAHQAPELRDTLLNPSFTGSLFGQGGRKDPQAATLRVQGRDLSGVRCYQHGGGGSQKGVSVDHPGQSIVLDVTPEGGAGLVVLQLLRMSGEEPVSDEEVGNFLKPFHVGPER